MSAYLSETIGIKRVKAYTANGTSTITSDTVDLQAEKADGVLFLTSSETAASDNILSVQHSSDDSSYSAVSGGAVVPGASDETQFVDLVSPSKRYVQAVFTRGTSTIQGPIYALLYRKRVGGVDNTTAGTIAGVALVGP
jgi:hypothetical protein